MLVCFPVCVSVCVFPLLVHVTPKQGFPWGAVLIRAQRSHGCCDQSVREKNRTGANIIISAPVCVPVCALVGECGVFFLHLGRRLSWSDAKS